jgi:hypothetical protein
MATAHFTLQGKGGVGKSLVSALIAQHRRENGIKMVCVDTDPINATFSGYKAFPVTRIDLMDGTKVNTREFDKLMQIIDDNPDCDIVVDNGASSFIPLSGYLVENLAIDMLADMGHKVIVHPVLTGGQAMTDTISGFEALADSFPSSAAINIWQNLFWGNIISKTGLAFEESATYKKYKGRINGIITIPKQSELFGQDLERMLKHRQTFNEATASDAYNFMEKNRLRQMKKVLFDQMDIVLGTSSPSSVKAEKELVNVD